MVCGGITMSFCETLLYIEKLEVCEASWSSNDANEEKPGFSSSWSWRESFWLNSRQQKLKKMYLVTTYVQRSKVKRIKKKQLLKHLIMGVKAPDMS